MFKIQEKLKTVKGLTKEWLKNKGTFDKQITSARADLELAIEIFEASPTSIQLQTSTHEKRNKLKSLFKIEGADLI